MTTVFVVQSYLSIFYVAVRLFYILTSICEMRWQIVVYYAFFVEKVLYVG